MLNKVRDEQAKLEDIHTHQRNNYPKPPDGGWGWVVVIGSLVCHMLADGCAFSSGVLFTEFLKYFKKSNSSTSWIASVFVSMPLICGPIASTLTIRYGCRKVTIGGGLLTMCGLVAAAFSPSIEVVCLTYGLISGIGLSMIYVPAIVIVAFYFEKKRSFATGLAVCGSGIGTATIAPLTDYLLNKYGWRSTLLIFAGIFANTLICGILFRPLDFSAEETNKLQKQHSDKGGKQTIIHSPRKVLSNIDRLRCELDTPGCHSNIQIPTYLTTTSRDCETSEQSEQMLETKNSFIKDYFVSIKPLVKTRSCSSKNSVSLSDTGSEKHEMLGNTEDSHTAVDHCVTTVTAVNYSRNNTIETTVHKNVQHNSGQFSRLDIFYPGNPSKVSLSCPNFVLTEAISDVSIQATKCGKIVTTVKYLFSEMTDLTDFKNTRFAVFAVSNFMLYFWYDVPYVFLLHRMTKQGSTPTTASLLITIIGIFNTIGQVAFGLLADYKWVSNITLYSTTIMLCGVSVMLIPFFNTFRIVAVLAGFFGLFVSSNYSMTTILLVNFVGMHRLTKSYGVLMLTQGIANLVGPPVAGSLYDMAGNYDNTFHVGGGFILVSGMLVLLCLCPCVSKHVSTVQDIRRDTSRHRSTGTPTKELWATPRRAVVLVPNVEKSKDETTANLTGPN